MEGQTNVLVKNSEEVLKGLKELQLFADPSLGDTSSSKRRFFYIDPCYRARKHTYHLQVQWAV